MVLADLGCVATADPHHRLVKKLRPSDSGHDVGVTTPQYRSPDVFLGNLRYQEALDMWSLGCVAAELFSRQPLIRPRERDKEVIGNDFIDAIRKEVGLPGQEMATIRKEVIGAGSSWMTCLSAELPLSSDVPGVETAASFLDSFPFFQRWFGQKGADWIAAETAKEERDPQRYAGSPASEGFEGCPAGLVILIKNCLMWKPEHRLTLPVARMSDFCSRLARRCRAS